ncbi:efflux RND transporter permease subunit [Thiothrix litoralis]|uniref:Efflux RND transporter permease subunit n=1 Tax=Thiothrix litoralis TaxID=2891210 RepID=A0ABX7WXE6_9GAMM|nr:efflux RND transporter permease subunit [Thiothrix litoralis]QTR47971.1 efflux RND transporter permease subunit [Thiothrix litoralis]
MNVSAWSIRNPVPAILLFALLTFLGIGGFKSLGIQQFPDIELPIITVSMALEGASPTQLETEVARKVENAVASLSGIKHIYANLTDGMAVVSVEFTIDKDNEVAQNEVRNAVDTIRATLPAAMTDPVVSKISTTGSPILTVTVASDKLDEQGLSWFVDNEVTKELLATKGVGRVSRLGGVDREVQVNLDPTRMSGLGVTASDISRQLLQVQQDASGGRGDVGGNIQSIRTLAAVQTADEIATLDIPLSDGRQVRLNQIAQINDTAAERSTYALLDGKPVIGFQVTRTKGASEVAVAAAARATIAQLKTAYPQVTFEEAFDTVTPVQENYDGSMLLLYEGAALAILVVFIFLRDWRATLVSAAALPLAIIPTFAVMHYFGYSLNLLTLLAMALVVGVLVDDAIVEVENIERHLRMGKTPYQAAMEAADEIGLAVIATTFTLIAVFLPTAFMGGIPGKFFEPFGITAAVAIFFSLIVARLLTPMMAAYIMKAHPQPNAKDGFIMRHYLRLARWCLRHRLITLVAALGLFAASLAIIPLLPTGFIPADDGVQTAAKLELQPGSNLDETYAVAEQARHLLADVPEITRVFTTVGYFSGDGGPFAMGASADVRKATLSMVLKNRHERSRKQGAIEADIRQRLQALPGARVTVGLGGEKMQIVLASDDAQALKTASNAVTRDLRTLKGIGNLSSSSSLQRPEIQIIPNYARAANAGITAQALSSTIQMATSGDFSAQLPKLNLPQRQIPIRVRLDKSFREDLDQIRQIKIPGSKGMVNLANVAEVRMGSGAAQIDRFDRKQNVTLDVELNGRSLGEVIAEADKLPSLQNLPAGVKRQNIGDAETMGELFGSFGTAMLIGIICIYIVLVLLLHDFLQPLTILAALPLSLGGALLALLVTGNSLSMPSVIGLLMLMGIVTKNSILLVDYAMLGLHEHGLGRFDALVDACHKRARPIVMTTIAMGAGMMPTALGLGADPSFRAPMAIVLIGGLIASTLLSLLVVPVVFTFVDDVLKGIRRLFGMAKTA